MNLLLKKTRFSNKKFYNKWTYKVTLSVPGAAIFRIYTQDDIVKLMADQNHFKRKSYYTEKAVDHKDHILNIIDFLKKNRLSDMPTRIERDSIDFYTNDRSIYESMSLKFLDRLIHRAEIRQGAIIDADNIISVSKYPHGKYQYKIFLKPHKFNSDLDLKKQYLSWIDSQGEKIKMSSAVRCWFLENNYNWDPRYIYIEDESTLLMLSMRNSDAIGKVYRYHIIDK